MFGVPARDPLHTVLNVKALVSPTDAVAMLGRALHASCAAHAIALATEGLPRPTEARPLRYASACSGIDLARPRRRGHGYTVPPRMDIRVRV